MTRLAVLTPALDFMAAWSDELRVADHGWMKFLLWTENKGGQKLLCVSSNLPAHLMSSSCAILAYLQGQQCEGLI